MPPTVHPWDQLPGEPDAAYARFVCYRSLGPSRSIASAEAAFNGKQRQKRAMASGQWTRDSSAYDWYSRANLFDLHQWQSAGVEATVLFARLIRDIARKLAETLPKVAPNDFAELMAATDALNEYLPPETIASILDQRGILGPPAGVPDGLGGPECHPDSDPPSVPDEASGVLPGSAEGGADA